MSQSSKRKTVELTSGIILPPILEKHESFHKLPRFGSTTHWPKPEIEDQIMA